MHFTSGWPESGKSFKKELQEGLRELGYVAGQNIEFEFAAPPTERQIAFPRLLPSWSDLRST